jgi:succinoglycan biosynthesis transport protein ExoP
MNKANPPNRIEESLPEFTLRDILFPIFRHRRLVAFTFGFVFLASMLFAWLWVANYYATTVEILVQQDRSDPAVTTGQNAAVQTGKEIPTDQITSEIALLQGRDMLRSVVVTCGLAESGRWSLSDVLLPQDPAQRNAAKVERATTALGKGLKVSTEKTSHVIEVKYGALADPQRPACVLKNLSQLYLAKRLQLRRPPGASEFFTEQTEEYKKALANDEAQLTNFSHDEGVSAPDVLRTNMATNVANSEASLYQARQTAAADEQRIKNDEAQLVTTKPRILTQQSTNADSNLLENLQANLLAAQVKRTQLLLKFEPTYPAVQEVDQEIAETQDAIKKAESMKYVNETTDRDNTYEFLKEDIAKAQSDLASQNATAKELLDSIQKMKTQMVDLDRKAVTQAALIREEKADEANYLLYLSKREQERSSDALDQRGIADVAIAVPPMVPVLPAYSPMLAVIVGFMLALVVGVSSGFIADYLDSSFRTPTEVLETLKVPVLASVPKQMA